MTELIELSANGVGLVLDASGPGLPAVLHWGADLGPLDDDFALATIPGVPPSAVDDPIRLTLLPSEEDGWLGRPGLSIGRHLRPRLTEPVAVSGNSLTVTAADADVELRTELHFDPEGV